ncbi:hypothetical protein MARPO_0005s0126 [Marchantia polymorpha]|uniref:Uncharacterized protein n=1 Tax=Marchantia polymorpha TaxID=3197 RepID=A0A2R6XQU5_MARPO|nr:hypothetical protein MARPO_0005s0126 [Marchantia polymorpha]|eukprot:PTQ48485.1 hypothetical protein MARPO_0005s0126 [Marchantia polymorpha]
MGSPCHGDGGHQGTGPFLLTSIVDHRSSETGHRLLGPVGRALLPDVGVMTGHRDSSRDKRRVCFRPRPPPPRPSLSLSRNVQCVSFLHSPRSPCVGFLCSAPRPSPSPPLPPPSLSLSLSLLRSLPCLPVPSLSREPTTSPLLPSPPFMLPPAAFFRFFLSSSSVYLLGCLGWLAGCLIDFHSLPLLTFFLHHSPAVSSVPHPFCCTAQLRFFFALLALLVQSGRALQFLSPSSQCFVVRSVGRITTVCVGGGEARERILKGFWL